MGELRPFQIGLLAVFGVLALIGLVMFANFKGFGRTAADFGSVTIWGTLPQDSIDGPLSTFKKGRKEYANVDYVERRADTFDADLADAIASGNGPDLIIISQEHLIEEQNRLTLIPSSSISERTYRDTYLPVYELFLTQGGSYGIPFVIDPLVLYYNRTILASAGASQAPRTWEAVTGLSPAITRASDAQTITRATVALGSYENVENARAILSLLFFQAGNNITAASSIGLRSTIGSRSDDVFGSTPAASALNFYTEFANPAKTTYSWNRSLPNSRQAFITGDLALYPGFASEQRTLAASNPNLDFDMAAIPQPGTATTRVTFAKAYVLAIPKASGNTEGAFEVAQAFAGRDLMGAMARSLGMAPAARSLLTPSNEDIYEPIYYPEALIARIWLSPLPTETDTVFASMIDNVSSGRQGAEQALITAGQALDAALR